MASVNTSQDQFQCSICLDVFSEPVSTPCGHNFCRSCIKDYWDKSEVKQCPLCMKTFLSAPELQVNSEFRDILELFKKIGAVDDDSSSPGHPSHVPCDLCSEVRCNAVKSCLICLASYCESHLEPHHRVQALKWHKLVRPVVSLESRACNKHNKLKEFFCRKEKSSVCAVCMRDDHVMHDVVSVEEELEDRKTQLSSMKVKVNQNVEEKTFSVQRIQTSVKQRRQKVDRIKAEVMKSFAALVALTESRKEKVIDLLERKQKAAEQEAEVLFKQLQAEVAENQRISKELEELLQSEDNFKLLQGIPFVSAQTDLASFTPRDQIFLQVETVRMAVARTEEVLNEQVENIIREANQTEEEEPRDPQTDKVFNDELEKIQQEYATKVTLDPNTAHPSLIVSQDRRQVRNGGYKKKVPDNFSRFDSLHYILGNEGFSSGRLYYEIALNSQTTWEVGVTRETISRKGLNLSLTPENGCWTLGCYWGRCQANSNPPVILPKRPEKLGVFVDYSQSLVSFYDVNDRVLIYSFTECSFSAGTVAPAAEIPNASFKSSLWKCRTYTGTSTNSMIYPIFRPSSEEMGVPLQILAVRCKKRK
ncbi:E3 ubiquitin-protein ligase TRIM39-like [Girardinichthys multiradiatus]|uniref:E3 ubiquitin-protein ligase TRIM39-like n=1 Tax=Girardinichthys multiradiatus TaxID=208333 RepID=UPI001FAC2FA2|nr:E3 ubiquitin-protein ligase TRIM39-like [Girardinichthys multiradiatus]